MSLKSLQLQAIFARRREAEHNRIERTEAVNKYYDHWGKVTSRFENWTAPGYYKQAEQRLENTKQKKAKEERLSERQKALAQLLEKENKNYELELHEKSRGRKSRKCVDIKTMEKINENLKEQQNIRRKLELEAKLYGKWRHGVDDDNLVFESKSDHEVLAKLNWLDKKVNEQLQREKQEEATTERELKLQQEVNKTEELQKERQQIREKEISEIRCIQESHLKQLKEKQRETDELKEKENQLRDNLNELQKELELLEESYVALNQTADFSDAHNFNKIKVIIRKRSEVFRNQINICLSILQRTLDFAEKPEVLSSYKKRLEEQLNREIEKLHKIDVMYESEAKCSLQSNEEIWHYEHTERYKELKKILMEEQKLINNSLTELIRRHDDLLKIRATHLSVIENSSEKLKHLIEEEENSPRYQKQQEVRSVSEINQIPYSPRPQSINNIIHGQMQDSPDSPLHSSHRNAFGETKSLEHEEQHQIDSSSRRNCDESSDNNMSPRCNEISRMSSSFSNLNLDVSHTNSSHYTQRELDSYKTNSQRMMQVVTPETEADRPRFGRKRVAWN